MALPVESRSTPLATLQAYHGEHDTNFQEFCEHVPVDPMEKVRGSSCAFRG
jgi:hypothetical protein